ncbi:MAG: hypothetical protein QOK37_2182 [Thermoanaerobaculia bacterium]|nr:hypothetical protein [Thermoanaerobaculia bacterium]
MRETVALKRVSEENLRSSFLATVVLSFASLAAATAPPPGANAVVAGMYKDFGWEAKPGHAEKPGLIEQPRAVLSRYFDGTLTALILADRKCVERTKEVCRLDFSPIWDSQDPSATKVNVLGSNDPAVVKVTFTDPESGRSTTLIYRMAKTKDGWRIHDIEYTSHESLLTILRRDQ